MKKIILIMAAFVLGLSSCTKDVIIRYQDAYEVLDTLNISDSKTNLVSIQEFGVLTTNSATTNAKNLQKAIDWAAENGAALYVTPVENGYPCNGGIILKKNVSLIGAHGPTGRGTVNTAGNGPTGSLFTIKDKNNVFITCESATQIKGIQFYYPEQTYNNAAKIVEYPATIGMSSDSNVEGVTLMNLSFYGEYIAMDFRGTKTVSEQLLFENCYGYPLSGQFIAIDKCYDIPRVLHCHVNPANQREFGRSFTSAVIDAVTAKDTYTYWFDNVDNLVLMDIFTFGAHGALYLGPSTYGQLTSFNFDCVNRGVYRTSDGSNNRTWMISQGSIIANLGDAVENVHPVIVEGLGGYTSLVGVEAFSGTNAALTTIGASYDFLDVEGSSAVSVSMTNCRMANYQSSPITRNNKNSSIVCTSCVDKNGDFFEYSVAPDAPSEIISGQTTVFDSCDSKSSWTTGFTPSTITVDTSDKQEGSGALSVTGTGTVVFTKNFAMPVDARVTKANGHFKMFLYISDASAIDLTKDGSIEVTSSGTCDKLEYAWKTQNLSLKTGWNELDLKLSSAGVTGGTPDLTSINYFRLYFTGVTSSVTIKIDDLKFYQE